MQSGSLSSTSTFLSRVLVDGVERPHSSWDVSGEVGGDLPEQVTVLSGAVAATGTIEWARTSPVSERPVAPFGRGTGWLPPMGARVVIQEGDGTTWWTVFTGTIDSTSGDLNGSPVSKVVDDLDRLEKPFSHAALQRIMPPRYRAESSYRGVGLTHLYYVDAALRRAGFHALPPGGSSQAVSVPAQSSMWPELGTMLTGVNGGTDGGPWAVTHDGPDGASISNVWATYSPNRAEAYGTPTRLSMTVAPDHAGTALMRAVWGGRTVLLSVASSRTVIAYLDNVEVCRLVLGAAVRVSLHIDDRAWELRTDTGASSAGTAASGSGSSILESVEIRVTSDGRAAGFHVGYTNPSNRWEYTDFVPSARYDMSDQSLLGLMDAGPAIEGTTCGQLLDEISAATLSAMWIDELGVFQWVPSRSLTGRTPVRTFTTADDILAMPWRDDLRSVRSGVVVKHRLPVCTRSRWDNVIWQQGGSDSLESGGTASEFVTPGTDTDWVGRMSPWLKLGEPGSATLAASNWGSLVGGVVTDGDTDVIAASELGVDVSQITPATWRIRYTAGTLPSGSKIEMRFPRQSTTIWPRLLGEPLPVFRGWAKTEWASVETTSDSEWNGPGWAPALIHDLGVWLNHESDNTVPQRLANGLAVVTRAPMPVITGMDLWPDPRIQRGDVIRIDSAAYLGARFNALVTGVDRSRGESSVMSVTIRLLSLTTVGSQTYEEWSASHPGALTYQQWAALTTQTYEAFAGSED